MKFLPLLFAPLALGVAVPGSPKINYDGYKAYRIATHHDVAAVRTKIAPLKAVEFNLDTAEHLDIVVPPAEVAAFESLDLETEVLHEDLGADIAKEAEFAPYEVSAQAVPSLSWFNTYHAYADHITFFNDLAGAFPQNSEIFSIGNSFQGRSIFGIHLWGSGGKGSKPAVYFHGTVHAREWITAKVVEYVAYQLLTQYNTDAAVKAMLDKYDFYILPFVNPDGEFFFQPFFRLSSSSHSNSGQASSTPKPATVSGARTDRPALCRPASALTSTATGPTSGS